MQKEIVNKGPLLDQFGNLREKGYARSLVLDYNRDEIKANSLRIKEWDYYLIYNDEFGIALTLDDNSYMSMESVSVLDFKNKKDQTTSPIQPFSLGKIGLPSSSQSGNVEYHSKHVDLVYKHIPNGRLLECRMDNFYKNQTFTCHLELTDEPKESMVIATPFEKEKHFYYNQKIVCFKAKGNFCIGQFSYTFHPDNTRAILDWGRGVWTYKNVWYWGAGCGNIDGHEVGFNIGYGFGDTSAASENVIFYDGVLHKLKNVTFNIPQDSNNNYLYTQPWTFTSNDNRFEMNFTPIMDRASCTDIKFICSNQHQVFGLFSGTMILDDGTKIELKDFLGFAERVYNKW